MMNRRIIFTFEKYWLKKLKVFFILFLSSFFLLHYLPTNRVAAADNIVNPGATATYKDAQGNVYSSTTAAGTTSVPTPSATATYKDAQGNTYTTSTNDIPIPTPDVSATYKDAEGNTYTTKCDPKIGVWNKDRDLCLPKPVFDPANDGTCTSEGLTGANMSGQVFCTQKLQAGPCELFELAVRANEQDKKGNVTASSFTCQEFIDPVPAFAVKNIQNALCITKTEGYSSSMSTFSEKKQFLDIRPAVDEARYCHAIAMKTTADFGILFSLVGYIFFIVQPLLISAGVGMIIYCGVQIMYGGGGTSEEAVKKVYKQLQQVLTGLALLFLIKLFLTTVNGLFFVM